MCGSERYRWCFVRSLLELLADYLAHNILSPHTQHLLAGRSDKIAQSICVSILRLSTCLSFQSVSVYYLSYACN